MKKSRMLASNRAETVGDQLLADLGGHAQAACRELSPSS
jgi:hypothetical protein